MAFEVFAISDEGTETVMDCELESEAQKAVVRLTGMVERGVWVNETSLGRVVGFNYDEGPGNERG